MLRKIRIILGTVFFVMITLLFLDFTGTVARWFQWMARVQFLPALLSLQFGILTALVVLTLVFGRIYCSVICPLGVFQDGVAWLHNRRKRNRYFFSKAKTSLRYGLLALKVIAYIAGAAGLVSLLAPYSSYGRMVTHLLQPLYIGGNNLLAALAAHFDSYAFYSHEVLFKGMAAFVLSLVSLVVVVTLAWKNGRTYCNTICPVGTLLGFLSRFSWLKIQINTDKCVKCGLCARNCKAACIDDKHHAIDYSRCVVCGDCIGNCHSKAITYSRHRPARQKAEAEAPAQKPETVDDGKRLFLAGTALATAHALQAQHKKSYDGGMAAVSRQQPAHRHTPIVPPGALTALNFAKHCTACQLCVSQCPNQILKPSTDLTRFMQPEVSYENGYCRPECTRCSEVCPAGAIVKIDKAEKSSIQIGHAVWVSKNCLPSSQGINCGNCARHYPTGAIQMVRDENSERPIMIPVINEERCIGCGACENLCPARPFAAIYVEGHEQHRTL